MTICSTCQSSNADDALFCARCGSQLGAAPPSAGHSAVGGMGAPHVESAEQADGLNDRAMLALARDEVPEALELVNLALLADQNHIPSFRTRIDILRRIGLTSQADVEAQKITQLEMGGSAYAGFWQRFGAFILDRIFVLLLSLVPAIALGAVVYLLVVPDNPTQVDEDDAIETATYAGYAVYGLITVIYSWIGNARGGTWGKRAIGIRVLSSHNGEPIGLARSFVRFLVYLVSTNVILGVLWMIWDKKKQTWHDKAAGSVVVKA